jgi:hypothetical protein
MKEFAGRKKLIHKEIVNVYFLMFSLLVFCCDFTTATYFNQIMLVVLSFENVFC